MRLRIEDIDAGRVRDEAADGIFEDLEWLGIDWDSDVWFQSQRTDAYRSALDRLDQAGLLYPCFCTRKDIADATTAPHGPDGPAYPGTCRRLSRTDREQKLEQGMPFALRIDSAAAFASVGPLSWSDRGLGRSDVVPDSVPDIVVARKDAPVSYALCVVVDDAAQAVTLVTRGLDLVPATPSQRLLQAVLGLPEPQYFHHRLVTGPDGRRLAKRDRSATVESLRESGFSPAEVRSLAVAHEKS